MKTVLVTGSSGFIGKNLIAQLEQEKDIEVLRFDRLNTTKELKKQLDEADFVFHLAGISRPKDDSEFDAGNRGLSEEIVSHIKECGRKTPVLLASSIQAELDNPYGKSKRAAEKAVLKLAEVTGSKTYVYRLPNVFGKWCKPNYNSVVATFCHNIANGLDITINDPEAQLTLVYIDDVVSDFIKTMRGEKTASADGFCHVSRNFNITLKELASKLYGFKESRETLISPDFENVFDRFLYATYTSYLDKKDFGYDLEMKSDERGWLAEFIKSKSAGQIFASRTKPGFARGNHWHHTKIEKFLVIDGEAEVKFRNLQSTEVLTYKVTGDELRVIDVPAGYVHSLKNVGKSDLLTLIWADEIFDPEHPDTYYLEV
jgi:UDP-2-acetamido-2,6-beta-L-arabino-hexul-4-ose reductase